MVLHKHLLLFFLMLLVFIILVNIVYLVLSLSLIHTHILFHLQKSVVLSITKVDYIAAIEADKEVIKMKDFIGELGIRQEEFRLYYDSQSAIHLPLEDQAHVKEISLAPGEGRR